MKKLLYTSFISALLWVSSGLVTIGSIYLSRLYFGANLIIGSLFIFLGLYLYIREKNLFEFLKTVPEDLKLKLYKKVIIGEALFVFLATLVGLVVLSAILSRVFGEGFAVFG